MISEIIKRKISNCQVILYRRVSTKSQSKGECASQFRRIKSIYPEFRISQNTIADTTEVMSGRGDPEVRMASGLGRSLKLLQRHPDAVLVVSDADRIARRADVFVLIQKQGLGHRVFDASTGMHVNDIVRSGIHSKIEAKTENLHAARQAGLQAYLANGGELGSPEISNHSRNATLSKLRLDKKRCEAITKVVRQLIHNSRGRVPRHQEICVELDHLEIRTGQNRFFTPKRLSQWKKQHPVQWREAIDSYAAPRRRLRRLITSFQVELRNRRGRKQAMRRRMRGVDFTSDDLHASQALAVLAFLKPIWRKEMFCGFRCFDQCRGPPVVGCKTLPQHRSEALMPIAGKPHQKHLSPFSKIDKYKAGGACNVKDTIAP